MIPTCEDPFPLPSAPKVVSDFTFTCIDYYVVTSGEAAVLAVLTLLMTICLLSSAVTSSTLMLRIGIAANALLFVIPAFPFDLDAYAAASVYYVFIDCC